MYVSDRKVGGEIRSLQSKYAFNMRSFVVCRKSGNEVVKWNGLKLLLLFQHKIEMHMFGASD